MWFSGYKNKSESTNHVTKQVPEKEEEKIIEAKIRLNGEKVLLAQERKKLEKNCKLQTKMTYCFCTQPTLNMTLRQALS